MEKTNIIIGLVLLNLFLVIYEFRQERGWRPYFAYLVILIIAVIFPPLSLMVLIPLTAWNLLFNTNRLRNVERRQ